MTSMITIIVLYVLIFISAAAAQSLFPQKMDGDIRSVIRQNLNGAAKVMATTNVVNQDHHAIHYSVSQHMPNQDVFHNDFLVIKTYDIIYIYNLYDQQIYTCIRCTTFYRILYKTSYRIFCRYFLKQQNILQYFLQFSI